MKLRYTAIMLTLCVTSCSKQEVTVQPAEKKDNVLIEHIAPDEALNVQDEVAKAIKANDFRLYGTAGRRIVLPGIKSEDMKSKMNTCGYKTLKGYKDNMKSQQEKLAIKKLRSFAKQYNLIMVKHCENKTN